MIVYEKKVRQNFNHSYCFGVGLYAFFIGALLVVQVLLGRCLDCLWPGLEEENFGAWGLAIIAFIAIAFLFYPIVKSFIGIYKSIEMRTIESEVNLDLRMYEVWHRKKLMEKGVTSFSEKFDPMYIKGKRYDHKGRIFSKKLESIDIRKRAALSASLISLATAFSLIIGFVKELHVHEMAIGEFDIKKAFFSLLSIVMGGAIVCCIILSFFSIETAFECNHVLERYSSDDAANSRRGGDYCMQSDVANSSRDGNYYVQNDRDAPSRICAESHFLRCGQEVACSSSII